MLQMTVCIEKLNKSYKIGVIRRYTTVNFGAIILYYYN